jgi:hypothetical protein
MPIRDRQRERERDREREMLEHLRKVFQVKEFGI